MTHRRTFIAAAAAATILAALPGAARAKDARSARVRVQDGTSIYVKDWSGSGRPVILTHAWPLSADIWDGPAAALSAEGYRVVTYDRRGFGRSGKPAAGYDFDTFSDDLATLIRELRLRDAALIGYSMGGGEVARYFSRHEGAGVIKAGFVGAAASCLLKAADNPGALTLPCSRASRKVCARIAQGTWLDC